MNQRNEIPPTPDMPDLVSDSPPLSHFEFWPSWLFYLPIKIYANLALFGRGNPTLPTITNPLFDAGGFVGESKAQILEQAPPQLTSLFCSHFTIRKTDGTSESTARMLKEMHEKMRTTNIQFPCVIKPNVGARGIGVQIAKNESDVKNYIASFPENEDIMMQDLADLPYEAGLFYIRHPDEKKGEIFSLTFKYFPHITGDGTSTVKELIMADPRAGKIAHLYLERHKEKWGHVLNKGERFKLAFAGSHSLGTIFKNGNPYITERMTEEWDALCKQIPEFYFGRFDIRFNNLKDLENAKNIRIIEINGASAEATHIWDSRTPLWQAYKTLFIQWHHMIAIAVKNKRRGFTPMRVKDLYKRFRRDKWLAKNYPLTH